MKNLFKALSIIFISVLTISCNKDEETVEPTVAKAYSEQIPGEITAIQKFFDDYHMNIDADKNIEFIERTGVNAGLTSIKAEFDPQFKTINYDGYDFKVYHIPTQTGVHTDRRPCPTDSVFVSYHGMLLNKKTGYDTTKTFNKNQTFDQAQNPTWFTLDRVVAGWTKMLAFFFPGNHTVAGNNVTFQDFGSGVLFLPSGLGYYGNATGTIPVYSPLIFNIKLMKVTFADNDFDQIETRDEEYEIETDPVKFANNPWKKLNRNTDGDNSFDYLDIDDDNDGYWTKVEMRNPAGGFFTYATVPTCTDGKKRIYSTACHN